MALKAFEISSSTELSEYNLMTIAKNVSIRCVQNSINFWNVVKQIKLLQIRWTKKEPELPYLCR